MKKNKLQVDHSSTIMDTVAQIKEKLDIVDFLKSYLKMVPAGKNLKALCPFHKEKTPSLMVSPDRGIWHCFGCSAGGDIFAFLMRYENLEFFEALKALAEKAGVDLRFSGNSDQKKFNVLYEINAAARDFFKANLAQTPEIQKYLESRGLTRETIEEFEIGFAPASSDALMRHLIQKGYSPADIERAGMIFKSERGTYWDRFKNRIMFPLWNQFGKVVGFTGRINPKDENPEVGKAASAGASAAKYVNSPETPIFNKSKILFGFHKTKNDIRNAGAAVLVEGQMDLIMIWQAGVRNAVAASGTALTSYHLQPIRRLADALIIAFDADEAGKAATERAIDLAETEDLVVKVLRYGDIGAKDPADIAKENPELIKKMAAEARPAMDYYFERYGIHKNADIVSLKKGVRVALSKIKLMKSAVERGHWLQKLSALARISEPNLTEEMERIDAPGIVRRSSEPEPENKKITRKELIADQLVSLAMMNSQFSEELKKYSEHLPLIHKEAVAGGQFTGSFASSGMPPTAAEDLNGHFHNLVRQLQKEDWKERHQTVRERLREAERKGDEAVVNSSLKEIDEINKKIHSV